MPDRVRHGAAQRARQPRGQRFGERRHPGIFKRIEVRVLTPHADEVAEPLRRVRFDIEHQQRLSRNLLDHAAVVFFPGGAPARGDLAQVVGSEPSPVGGAAARQREPELKAAVKASLGGDIKKAFEKLGSNVAEVEPDNLPGAAAARWLRLSPEQRENTGLIAPSHKLRHKINDIVRERLTREGQVTGPALETTRLMSRGYTRAQKTMADNYTAGSVVGFHRPYKRLGVEQGDELKVRNVDRSAGTVNLIGNDGEVVKWEPTRRQTRKASRARCP